MWKSKDDVSLRKVRVVAYYRVSTDRQWESGLGLESQRSVVRGYVEERGKKLVGEYEESESGRKVERPKLGLALAHAKRSGAELVVARLDRLGRNVAFLSSLLESGVDFVCCDNPAANRLTIHVLAAVAEYEGLMIGRRTSEALIAAVARGVKLGSAREGYWEKRCGNGHGKGVRAQVLEKMRERSLEVRRAKMVAAYMHLVPMLLQWRKQGMSYEWIGLMLAASGHTTRRGGTWSAMQVKRVLDMARREEKENGVDWLGKWQELYANEEWFTRQKGGTVPAGRMFPRGA